MPSFIRVSYIPCCVFCWTSLVCSEKMEGTKEEIIGMIRAVSDRVKQGKDFADLFTEDGVILPPGEPPAIGTADLSKFIKKYYDDYKMAGLDFYEPEITVLAGGKNAYSWHRFTLYNSEGKNFMSGKCVLVWKKDEVRNEWLVVLDMFNEAP